ncbi:MAG: cytochrome C [Alphaproteobacteria bacterium]|nr:MAG: cytochrome C [Alphaproteobacteria bacterium]
MRAALIFVAPVVAALLAALFLATQPRRADPAALAGVEGDAGRGARVFWAGGCASCHAAPKAEGDARLILSGGRRLVSPFGDFIAPNISSDPDHGIGGWSVADLASALRHGTSPDGAHYYPAFPYTSYAKMTYQDIADLRAFLAGLPASDRPNAPHELGFPFNIRRAVGLWKLLYFDTEWVLQDAPTPKLARGRYLAEALGHCGECHTPRNALGGLDRSRWLAGGPNPAGKGRIPNITPARLDWSEAEIAYYLETGFTPEFDSAGGEMAEVVENLSHLPPEDREALAAYLKAVPPVP